MHRLPVSFGLQGGMLLEGGFRACVAACSRVLCLSCCVLGGGIPWSVPRALWRLGRLETQGRGSTVCALCAHTSWDTCKAVCSCAFTTPLISGFHAPYEFHALARLPCRQASSGLETGSPCPCQTLHTRPAMQQRCWPRSRLSAAQPPRPPPAERQGPGGSGPAPVATGRPRLSPPSSSRAWHRRQRMRSRPRRMLSRPRPPRPLRLDGEARAAAIVLGSGTDWILEMTAFVTGTAAARAGRARPARAASGGTAQTLPRLTQVGTAGCNAWRECSRRAAAYLTARRTTGTRLELCLRTCTLTHTHPARQHPRCLFHPAHSAMPSEEDHWSYAERQRRQRRAGRFADAGGRWAGGGGGGSPPAR